MVRGSGSESRGKDAGCRGTIPAPPGINYRRPPYRHPEGIRSRAEVKGDTVGVSGEYETRPASPHQSLLGFRSSDRNEALTVQIGGVPYTRLNFQRSRRAKWVRTPQAKGRQVREMPRDAVSLSLRSQ